MADVVSKLVTAISAIEDDLTDKVVPAEININGSLSMNGATLTNTGAVQFVSGNDPTAAGSVYYSAGEFYAIDSTGVVQLTANGALNFAAAGAIVGDYGGVNPAKVTYNDAAGEYRFTEDTGVWADLVADDLVLKSASGSVRFGVTNDITTDRSFFIKSLPASGISILTYDASDSSVSAGSVSAVDALAITTLTLTNPEKHSDYEEIISVADGYVYATGGATFTVDYTGGAGSGTFGAYRLQKTSAGGTVTWIGKLRRPVGEWLKNIKLTLPATSSVRIDGLFYGSTTNTGGSGITSGTGAEMTVTNAIQDIVATPITPNATNLANTAWGIRVTLGGNGDSLDNIKATFNRT